MISSISIRSRLPLMMTVSIILPMSMERFFFFALIRLDGHAATPPAMVFAGRRLRAGAQTDAVRPDAKGGRAKSSYHR